MSLLNCSLLYCFIVVVFAEISKGKMGAICSSPDEFFKDCGDPDSTLLECVDDDDDGTGTCQCRKNTLGVLGGDCRKLSFT